MSAPETYWEQRAALAEEALERLAVVVLSGNPMLHERLQDWANEWARLRGDIHTKFEDAARASGEGEQA